MDEPLPPDPVAEEDASRRQSMEALIFTCAALVLGSAVVLGAFAIFGPLLLVLFAILAAFAALGTFHYVTWGRQMTEDEAESEPDDPHDPGN